MPHFDPYATKDYHFTDAQIDIILRVVRNTAFRVKYDSKFIDYSFNSRELEEIANLIEDQITNHPENPV